jgi:hypothetical protein
VVSPTHTCTTRTTHTGGSDGAAGVVTDKEKKEARPEGRKKKWVIWRVAVPRSGYVSDRSSMLVVYGGESTMLSGHPLALIIVVEAAIYLSTSGHQIFGVRSERTQVDKINLT